MQTGLFISTNGNVTKAQFDGLRDMQRAVGGLIEPIEFMLGGNVCDVYVNQEGYHVAEEYQIPNPLASALIGFQVVGDAFVIGGVDSEGEATNLPVEVRDVILDMHLAGQN